MEGLEALEETLPEVMDLVAGVVVYLVGGTMEGVLIPTSRLLRLPSPFLAWVGLVFLLI
jgi:hypothetical protein